jgi:hypothetical protein
MAEVYPSMKMRAWPPDSRSVSGNSRPPPASIHAHSTLKKAIRCGFVHEDLERNVAWLQRGRVLVKSTSKDLIPTSHFLQPTLGVYGEQMLNCVLILI